MPEAFFELGQRSRCLFTPDLWCDHFPYQLPSAAVDFLCDIVPQTLVGVLPSAKGEEGKQWDQTYKQIARAWGDRRVGFQCHRVGADAWTSPQPCQDCELVRKAQVVVIDLNGSDQRSAIFLQMAAASATSLQVLQKTMPFVPLPSKKVILINRGEADILPHFKHAFDYIDYANPQGETDLARLSREMSKLALSAQLFKEGTLDLGDLSGPQPSEVIELKEEDLIRFVDEEEIEVRTEAETPVKYMLSEEIERLFRESGVPELLEVAEKSIDKLGPERALVAEAERAMKQKRFVEAIRLLHQWVAPEDPNWQRYKKGRIRTCLDELSGHEVVDIFFDVANPKRRLVPSAWRDVHA